MLSPGNQTLYVPRGIVQAKVVGGSPAGLHATLKLVNPDHA
jgi:hypothetical protein